VVIRNSSNLIVIYDVTPLLPTHTYTHAVVVAIVAGKPELADSLTRGYGVKFYTLAAVSDDNLQKHAMVGCSFSTVTSAWDTASVPSASAV